MLNMADDDLDAYEYRLLGHYVRRWGENGREPVVESVRDAAAVTRMSVGTVSAARKRLEAKGYIVVAAGRPDRISVVDRMDENVARYRSSGEQRSGHEQRSSGERIVHQVNVDVHQVNNSSRAPIKDKKDIEDKQQVAAQAPATPATKPKAARPRDPMFDAIALQFGYMTAVTSPTGETVYDTTMTGATATLIGKVRTALKNAGYAPDDIPKIYAWCLRQQWTGFSPAALEKAADQWRAEQRAKAPRIVHPAPTHVQPPPRLSDAERAEAARRIKEARTGNG